MACCLENFHTAHTLITQLFFSWISDVLERSAQQSALKVLEFLHSNSIVTGYIFLCCVAFSLTDFLEKTITIKKVSCSALCMFNYKTHKIIGRVWKQAVYKTSASDFSSKKRSNIPVRLENALLPIHKKNRQLLFIHTTFRRFQKKQLEHGSIFNATLDFFHKVCWGLEWIGRRRPNPPSFLQFTKTGHFSCFKSSWKNPSAFRNSFQNNALAENWMHTKGLQLISYSSSS